jgi:cytoskeleton protein RodZ
MSGEASIGQVFRQRREERGLTVEQAAFQSKVPLRLLQALESDDYHLLPDPMYLIRFLHEYALLLKLDPAALEAAFQEATRRPPKASLAAAPPPPPMPAIPWKQVIWTAAAIVVVTPLVFIALSLSSKRVPEVPPPVHEPERAGEEQAPENGGGGMPDRSRALRSDNSQGADAPVQEMVGATPKSLETSGAGVSPERFAAPAGELADVLKTVQPTGAESRSPGQLPSPPPASAASAARLVLVIRATETAWVSVRSDTAGRRQVLLKTGQAASFDADEGFVVTLGNAGGVALSLNGVSMPVLGKSGEVVRDLPIPPVRPEASPPAPVQ